MSSQLGFNSGFTNPDDAWNKEKTCLSSVFQLAFPRKKFSRVGQIFQRGVAFLFRSQKCEISKSYYCRCYTAS